VTAAEEWARLAPVLPALCRARLPAVISVDTRHFLVARAAAEAGARLLNLPFPEDLLSGAPIDEVRGLLQRFDGVVLMHSRGTPQTMGRMAGYDGDLCRTVAAELFATAMRLCGEDAALRSRVIFDPGLGFAKSAEGSLSLLGQTRRLGALLGRPILVGASRKSFLGVATGLPPGERLVPSVTAAALAARDGAAIVRVHDVAATRAALALLGAVAAANDRGEPGARAKDAEVSR
jgi:dihydropteroate synthase